MIAAALVALAVYAFAGPQIVAKGREWASRMTMPTIDGRHVAGIALIVAAGVLFVPGRHHPAPQPQPLPPDAFSLRGKFVGPTAAEDAAAMSALCAELADCLEQDGIKKEPRLRTGVAFDDLRIAAREARMKGESIGARQPGVKAAVHAFLDDAVGTSGGPVTPESRAAWVKAFRDLARACADVVSR